MAGAKSSEKAEPAVGRRGERRPSSREAPVQALLDSMERLHATLDGSAIATALLEVVGELLGVKRCALYLGAPDAQRLGLRGAVGLDAPERLPSIGFESNFVRWLADAARPVHLDELFASSADAAGGDEEAMRALLNAGLSYGIALVDQGTLFGVLLCGGTAADERPVRFDDERLAALALSASRALGNAATHEAAVASRFDLERFSRVKRELVERASGELATSLAVVTNSLWSLEPEGIGDKVLVDMARDAVVRLQGAVERLASFGAVELDATRFDFVPSDVSGFLEDVLREFIPELEEKQIEVETIGGAIDRKAMIDTGKVKFVVRSMLDTAIKHTARGGTIRIVTRVTETRPGTGEGIEIAAERSLPGPSRHGASSGGPGGINERAGSPLPTRSVRELGGSPYVVVTIVEGGGDISPEEMNALVEPVGPSSDPTGGSGSDPLPGLAISREIVAGHGGMLFHTRQAAEGARFSLWLPLSA